MKDGYDKSDDLLGCHLMEESRPELDGWITAEGSKWKCNNSELTVHLSDIKSNIKAAANDHFHYCLNVAGYDEIL